MFWSRLALFIVGALLFATVYQIEAVAYDALCTADADCTATNGNTTCEKEVTPTCTQGKCKCEPIFDWDSGASKCKLKKFYLDPCDDTMTVCTEGSVCTSGQCLCSGGTTFNANLRLCTNLKAVGEACSVTSDCYTAVTNAVECASSGQCACALGYVPEKGSCRLPRYGETCQNTPDCTSLVSSLDVSLLTETCGSAGTCACPTTPANSLEDILMDGKIYKACLETPASGTTLIAVAAICTQSNQCSSKLCMSCPEFTAPQKQCVGTILQRRRKSVKMDKTETLLILRAYLAHPTKWADILDEVKQNIDQLPATAKQLYQTSNSRQLRDRMSTKLGKLISQDAENIEDVDIRTVVQDVKGMERRLVRRPSPPRQPDQRDQAAEEMTDSADEVLEGEQNDPDADQAAPPQDNGQRERPRKAKKRPLVDIIRENQLEYNKFIKKKVPKLLRQLGVSSSSDESD